MDVGCFDSYSLYGRVVLGFSCINMTAIWHIKLQDLECPHITERTRSQEPLDRLTIFGHHQMKVEPIKIALLAGDISAILLVLG
jgi:hypothetical protein